MIENIKNIIGIIAIVLTFVGYIPYIKDLVSGKTKPHIYSWLLWGVVTSIAFGLQIVGGGGVGSFVTLAAAIMCFIVIGLSFKYGTNTDITTSDKVFLALAFITLIIWLFAKQPLLSIILATTIDLLGFVPTIRKSWNNPFTETVSFYFLNTFRFTLAVISLTTYSLLTWLYPVSWLLANGLFGLMLVLRRHQLK